MTKNKATIFVLAVLLMAMFVCSCSAERWTWPNMFDIQSLGIKVPKAEEKSSDTSESGSVFYAFDPSGSMKGYLGLDCDTYKTVFTSVIPIMHRATGFIDIAYEDGKLNIGISDDFFKAEGSDDLGHYMKDNVCVSPRYSENTTELGDLIKAITKRYTNNAFDKITLDDIIVIVTDMVFEDSRGETVKTQDVFNDVRTCITDMGLDLGIALIRIEADYAFGEAHMSANRSYYYNGDKLIEKNRVNRNFEYRKGERITQYDPDDDPAGHIMHPLFMLAFGPSNLIKSYTDDLHGQLDKSKYDIEHQMLVLAEDVPQLSLSNKLTSGVRIELSDTLKKLNGSENPAEDANTIPPGYAFYWDKTDAHYQEMGEVNVSTDFLDKLERKFYESEHANSEVASFIKDNVPIYPICLNAASAVRDFDDCYITATIDVNSNAVGRLAKHWAPVVDGEISIEEVRSNTVENLHLKEDEPARFAASNTAAIDVNEIRVVGNEASGYKLVVKCRLAFNDLVKSADLNQTVLYRVNLGVSLSKKDDLEYAAMLDSYWAKDYTVDWKTFEIGKTQQLDKTPNLWLFNEIVVSHYAEAVEQALATLSADTEFYFGLSFRATSKTKAGFYMFSTDQANSIIRQFSEEP